MNTRHKRVKAEGWKARAPSRAVFAQAVVEENNLLRRPILLHGGRLVVGRDLDGIRAILA